jgi:hypothetical protein
MFKHNNIDSFFKQHLFGLQAKVKALRTATAILPKAGIP